MPGGVQQLVEKYGWTIYGKNNFEVELEAVSDGESEAVVDSAVLRNEWNDKYLVSVRNEMT